eukprot:747095-Hanusia_phi.AAC.2
MGSTHNVNTLHHIPQDPGYHPQMNFYYQDGEANHEGRQLEEYEQGGNDAECQEYHNFGHDDGLAGQELQFVTSDQKERIQQFYSAFARTKVHIEIPRLHDDCVGLQEQSKIFGSDLQERIPSMISSLSRQQDMKDRGDLESDARLEAIYYELKEISSYLGEHLVENRSPRLQSQTLAFNHNINIRNRNSLINSSAATGGSGQAPVHPVNALPTTPIPPILLLL